MSGLSELLDDLKDKLAETKKIRQAHQQTLTDKGLPADVALTRLMAVEFQFVKAVERIWTELDKRPKEAPIADQKDELTMGCESFKKEMLIAVGKVLTDHLLCLDCFAERHKERDDEFEQPNLTEIKKAEQRLDESGALMPRKED